MGRMGVDSVGSYELADELERKSITLREAFGTPSVVGPSLCFRCQHSHIFRRKAHEFDATVLCLYGREHRMPIDIIECNQFTRQNELTLAEMSQMATLVSDVAPRKGGYL